MLKVVLLAAAGAAFLGCADGEDDPRAALADAVARAMATDPEAIADRLGELGVAAGPGDVPTEGSALSCPSVPERRPGDDATCTATIAGTRVAIDVTFEDDETVTVTGLDLVR